MNNCTVIIHAAGNKAIGIGNLVRCYELYRTLKDKYNFKIITIFECDNAMFNFINNDKFDIFRFDSRSESIEFFYRLNKTQKYIYISDIIDQTAEVENIFRSCPDSKILHLNDSGLDSFNPDVIIDGDIFAKPWNRDNGIVLQSPKYHIVKHDIAVCRPKSYWKNSSVQSILICFSGSDPAGYTEKLLNELQSYQGYKHFTFILGPGFSRDRVSHITENNKDFVTVLVNVTDMASVILEHDVVVSLGGGVVYEAMLLGRPCLGVGWQYLEYYIDQMELFGVIKKIDSNNMLSEIEFYTDDIKLLQNMADKAWQNIDDLGAVRISDYIYESLR
ncbi:hypothetical protein NFHSH190041_03820 [Shewanella sp. NFH-SH190041]|uniref:hypothetical protein n=1 Tax=Shewanella sp. NFH-SH190041 TaxID=2950245 RepID=UPI0021C38718|nr:hypothetical protein [Shewanella sp. NFH-SH190041]BDM62930.1 hypothetical protein NFHSH190041_03820 [Shewanella sp. NFH-SH190041]